MKKLLYLIPLILIGLSTLPLSLYKDKVDFAILKNPASFSGDFSSVLTTLDPQHWKMINFSTSSTGSLEPAAENDTSQSEAEHIYEVAEFHGFPFAAYFSANETSKTSTFTTHTEASGWSWLWATIDAVLIMGTLVFAIMFNRKKGQA
jgi:hypothetical protein